MKCNAGLGVVLKCFTVSQVVFPCYIFLSCFICLFATASDHVDDKQYVGYIMQGLQHEGSPYREAIINVSFAIDGKLPTIANLPAMLMRIEGLQVARQE